MSAELLFLVSPSPLLSPERFVQERDLSLLSLEASAPLKEGRCLPLGLVLSLVTYLCVLHFSGSGHSLPTKTDPSPPIPGSFVHQQNRMVS